MFRRIFEFIESAVTGGPYRIRLERQQIGLVLVTFKGRNSLSFTELPDRYEPIKHIARTLPVRDRALLVPIARLAEVKAVLQSLSGSALEVYTAPDVQLLRQVEMPADFAVSYVWSKENSCIEQHITRKAEHLGNGWFAAANYYWRVKGTNIDDNRWLNQRIIEGNDILEFLTRPVPDWKRRGLPYGCDLKLSDDPMFSILIRDVQEDAVDVFIDWKSPAHTAASVPSLSGYVNAEGIIRPGVSPQQLAGLVPEESGAFSLTGQDIPRFLRDVWPRAHPWIVGRVPDLTNLHPISLEKCELILAVQREEREGIGLTMGIPTLVWGDFRIEAEEVSRSLHARLEFVRLDKKWVPVEELRRSGIGLLGRSANGSTLSPITLTPTDILYRYGENLKGSWTRIEFPVLDLPQGSTPHETARLHLEFLRTWGFSGGTVGAPGIAADAIREMLVSFIEINRDAKVLVVGAKRSLDALASEWEPVISARFDGGRKDPDFSLRIHGIVQATPKALETVPDLTKTAWSILCLLEADTLIKSDSSNLFYLLQSCSKALTIGMFHGTDFLNRTVAQRALSEIFANNRYEDVVWKFGLRHLAETSSSELGAALQPTLLSIDPAPAEYTIDSADEPASLPVPPVAIWSSSIAESESTAIPGDAEYIKSNITTSYSTGNSKFEQDARRWVSRREESALYIPFHSYYPTYDVMTKAQLKWYFYWRGQVRECVYPDTDLSYIFVHIYELINNIGVKDPMDGYQQLHKVWMNYRSRHNNLDNYLVDWIADYLIINHCPVDPLDIYVEAMRTEGYFSHWDLVLEHYLRKGLRFFPLGLIEQLSDYRIRKSKFYLQGYNHIVDEYVPKVLERVNADMLARSRGGIFDVFKPRASRAIQRYPFNAAIYSGRSNTITIANVFPYREHPPLRQFITAVVKHTENRLRDIKKFKGQLRGYSIDPEVRALIDDRISGASQVISPPPPKPKVMIDHSKVHALIRDSNDVRDRLLSNDENTPYSTEEVSAVKASGNVEITASDDIVRPAGTPPHLLTDLVPINRILRSLDDTERQLIKILMQNNWEIDNDALKACLAGVFIEPIIDRINEVSLNTLGDILIASEGNIKLIVDDFRDEIEYLLSLPEEGETPVSQEELTENLPKDWAELKAKLSPEHFKVLRALIEEADPNDTVIEIAGESGTMPEVLIDLINEAALDTLGDIIIDTSSGLVSVEEEDLEMVQKLVAMQR